MKKRIKKIILLMLVAELLLCSSLASASAYFNQTEDFETGDVGENPSATWYSYNNLLFEWANISSTKYAGSQGFQINDTTVADGSVTYFNLTADSYDYCQFYFKINNNTHNETRIYISDSAGTALARFDIGCWGTGKNITVTYRNYSAEIWNNTAVTNNTWYRLRWDFNYTDDEMRGRLFTSGGTALNDTWCPITSASGAYDYSNTKDFSIHGVSGQYIQVYLDNLKFYKAYNWGATGVTTNYILDSIIPLLFAIFLLIVIAGMALSGSFSIEAMIGLMLAAIIGMVTLSVVFAI